MLGKIKALEFRIAILESQPEERTSKIDKADTGAKIVGSQQTFLPKKPPPKQPLNTAVIRRHDKSLEDFFEKNIGFFKEQRVCSDRTIASTEKETLAQEEDTQNSSCSMVESSIN